jgi:hypothetical protein
LPTKVCHFAYFPFHLHPFCLFSISTPPILPIFHFTSTHFAYFPFQLHPFWLLPILPPPFCHLTHKKCQGSSFWCLKKTLFKAKIIIFSCDWQFSQTKVMVANLVQSKSQVLVDFCLISWIKGPRKNCKTIHFPGYILGLHFLISLTNSILW